MRHPIIEEDLAKIVERDVPWDDLRGKTIVISGAYGFVIAYLVEAILYYNEKTDAGIHVVGIVRSREKAAQRFGHYEGRSDLSFIYQDVCDPVTVDGPVDYIVHGASWASPKYYGSDPVGSLAPNVFGTRNLLELAREKSSKGFLFISSAEIYGEADDAHIPTPEAFRGSVEITDVRSCYAEAKRMGETMCVSWQHQHSVPVTMARLFHTYGPGMALDDGRTFADFVSDIVHDRDITLISDGSAIRCYCYLADAVVGMLTILLRGSLGEAYNLGNDDAETSVLDLAQLLVGLYPDKGLKVVQKQELRQANYLKSKISRVVPDTGKLRGLGWTPAYLLEEGFRRSVASYLPVA